jgi:glucokinase
MNRPLRRATPSIIERTGIMTGRAIASAAAVFDVTTFYVTGGVVDTFGDAVLEPMRREVALRSRLTHLSDLQVFELSGYNQPLVSAASVAIRAAPASSR